VHPKVMDCRVIFARDVAESLCRPAVQGYTMERAMFRKVVALRRGVSVAR